MPRLPEPGGDDNEWGDILNEFLEVSLDTSSEPNGGKLKPEAISDAGGQLTSEKGQPNGYASLDSNGKVPASELDIDKSSVGLDNVDNTSDVDKPISSATQTALDNRLLKAGDTMSGNLNMGGSQVTNLGTTTNDADAATKSYVDYTLGDIVSKSTAAGSSGFRAKYLDNWFNALNNAPSSPVDIVVVGDSISVLGSWPNKLIPLTTPLGATRSTAGSFYYAKAGGGIPTLSTAEGVQSSTVGAGGYSVTMSNGQVASQSYAYDAITVIYTRQPLGGKIEVRDGGPSGTLLTTIDTSGAQKSSLMWTSDELAYSSRQIHLTAVCSGSETVILEGIYFHSGTLSRGVRVWSVGRSGIQSSGFTDNPSLGLDLVENLDPDLVIVATGTNDGSVSDPSEYITKVSTLIGEVRTRTSSDIALWVPYINNVFSRAEAALGRELSDALEVGLIDASVALGDFSAAANPEGTPLSTDHVHPTGGLTNIIAQHVFSVINGDPIGKAYRNYAFLEQRVASAETSLNSSTKTWTQAGGSVEIGSFFGAPTFNINSNTAQYFSIGNPAVNSFLSQFESSSIGLGDGSNQMDVIIWREAPGQISINRGSGSIRAIRPIKTVTDAAYSLVIEDQSVTIEGNSLSAQTITVPSNSSVEFPIGSVVYINQFGTGQVSLQPDTGVTLNAYDNNLETAGQYASLMLHKRATNEWIVTALPLDSGGGGGSSSIPKPSVITESGSARTLATSDAWDYIRLTNATECDITVPDNSDDPIPVGTQIYLRSAGTGVYTIVEDSAVTVNPPSGGSLTLAGDAALIKVATDEWDLIGATLEA